MPRPRVDWMRPGPDDRILEVLNESPFPMPPKAITYVVDYSHGYIRQRLPPLLEHGLIRHPPNMPDDLNPGGLYEITELGRRYLAGEASKTELE